MPSWPGFIGGSNTPQSITADAERAVNLYVEPVGSRAGSNGAALYGTPGFQSWSSVPDAVTRALAFVANSRLFGVIGSSIYEWNSVGGATNRGAVVQDSNPAQIIYNGVVGGQLGFCSGGNVYSYNLATNVLAGPHLTGGYTHLAYADGYGLAFNPISGKVNLSNLNDLSTYSAGTFFQRSKFPDPWVAMFVDPNALIWLIGPETFEVWYDTGTGTQPWAPLSGLVGRHGIVAPFAYGVSGAGQFWLARSPEGGATVVRTSGASPEPVSTYAVDTAIRAHLRAGQVSDSELLLYHDEGHTFANVSFPTANATWTYDAKAGGWAERGKWNSAQGRYDVWAPRAHADAWGLHLVGDRSTGTIWTMDTAYHTDIDGNGIRRLRRSPAIVADGKRIAIDQVQLLMDVGRGTATGQGSNPQAMLRVSEDGGDTWSNELMASTGRIGNYRQRVTWNRLGLNDEAVIEVAWSDPAPVRVVNAFLNNQERVA